MAAFSDAEIAGDTRGGAVQVDPGFPLLTPRLLSGTFRDFQRVKPKSDKPPSNFALQLRPAPLQPGGVGRTLDVTGRRAVLRRQHGARVGAPAHVWRSVPGHIS